MPWPTRAIVVEYAPFSRLRGLVNRVERCYLRHDELYRATTSALKRTACSRVARRLSQLDCAVTYIAGFGISPDHDASAGSARMRAPTGRVLFVVAGSCPRVPEPPVRCGCGRSASTTGEIRGALLSCVIGTRTLRSRDCSPLPPPESGSVFLAGSARRAGSWPQDARP